MTNDSLIPFVKTTGLEGGVYRDDSYYWRLWHHNWDDADIAVIRALLTPADQNILEVGCGDGRVALSLNHPNSSIVGIDINQQLIDLAKSRLISPKEQRVSFQWMDGEKLELSDSTFDAVLLPWCLQLMKHPARAISEAHRVLRPGGKAIAIGLLSDSDYDKIIGEFVDNVEMIDEFSLYQNPLQTLFGAHSESLIVEARREFPIYFENIEIAQEAFIYALDFWNNRSLNSQELIRLKEVVAHYLVEDRVRINFPATVYRAFKT